jgi:hypothetical protein
VNSDDFEEPEEPEEPDPEPRSVPWISSPLMVTFATRPLSTAWLNSERVISCLLPMPPWRAWKRRMTTRKIAIQRMRVLSVEFKASSPDRRLGRVPDRRGSGADAGVAVRSAVAATPRNRDVRPRIPQFTTG